MKKNDHFFCVVCLSMVLIISACSHNDTNLVANIEAPVYIADAITDVKLQQAKESLKLTKKRKVLANGTISNDGKLPIEEMSNENSKLFLLDVHNNTYDSISEKSANVAFTPVYQDETIFVYFEYEVGGLNAIPKQYYVYDKQTQQQDIIDLTKIINVGAMTTPDTTVVRIQNNLYFEVQDRRRITDEENSWDNGLSIYKYNLATQEIAFVVAGMAPRNQHNDLYYIKNTPEVEGILTNYTRNEIIASNVYEYAIFNDSIMYTKIEDETFRSYLVKGSDTEYLFTQDDFWHYNMNKSYITWQQTGENLYVYDLTEKQFVLLSSKFGSNYAMAAEKYLFWTESTFNSKSKTDVEVTLIYVQL